MGLHSKWTTGGLEFYQTGTTYIALRIPLTGHGFEFGESGNGFDVKIHGVKVLPSLINFTGRM